MIQIMTNIDYAQCYGVRFALHIGTLLVMFGRKESGRGARLEVFTRYHWFRWSKGYVKK